MGKNMVRTTQFPSTGPLEMFEHNFQLDRDVGGTAPAKLFTGKKILPSPSQSSDGASEEPKTPVDLPQNAPNFIQPSHSGPMSLHFRPINPQTGPQQTLTPSRLPFHNSSQYLTRPFSRSPDNQDLPYYCFTEGKQGRPSEYMSPELYAEQLATHPPFSFLVPAHMRTNTTALSDDRRSSIASSRDMTDSPTQSHATSEASNSVSEDLRSSEDRRLYQQNQPQVNHIHHFQHSAVLLPSHSVYHPQISHPMIPLHQPYRSSYSDGQHQLPLQARHSDGTDGCEMPQGLSQSWNNGNRSSRSSPAQLEDSNGFAGQLPKVQVPMTYHNQHTVEHVYQPYHTLQLSAAVPFVPDPTWNVQVSVPQAPGPTGPFIPVSQFRPAVAMHGVPRLPTLPNLSVADRLPDLGGLYARPTLSQNTSWTDHFDILQMQRKHKRRSRKSETNKDEEQDATPHQCPLCNRTFERRNGLAIHLKWHYKERDGALLFYDTYFLLQFNEDLRPTYLSDPNKLSGKASWRWRLRACIRGGLGCFPGCGRPSWFIIAVEVKC